MSLIAGIVWLPGIAQLQCKCTWKAFAGSTCLSSAFAVGFSPPAGYEMRSLLHIYPHRSTPCMQQQKHRHCSDGGVGLHRPCEKNWCMEMPTIDTPMLKLNVSLCPNSAADSTAVNSVAIVEEYLKRRNEYSLCFELKT